MSLEAHHQFILNTMQRHDDIARKLIQELEAENARLKAEVERLRKAGDAVVAEAYAMANKSDWPYTFDILAEEWNAAKEGKQP